MRSPLHPSTAGFYTGNTASPSHCWCVHDSIAPSCRWCLLLLKHMCKQSVLYGRLWVWAHTGLLVALWSATNALWRFESDEKVDCLSLCCTIVCIVLKLYVRMFDNRHWFRHTILFYFRPQCANYLYCLNRKSCRFQIANNIWPPRVFSQAIRRPPCPPNELSFYFTVNESHTVMSSQWAVILLHCKRVTDRNVLPMSCHSTTL